MRFYLRAIAYFREDLPLIIASLVLIGLSTLAGLLQPFFWSILIDCILTTFTGRFLVYSVFFRLTHFLGVAQNDRPRQIIVLAALAAGLRILQELLGMAQRLLSAYIGYNGLIRVRCDLFRKLQQLSLGYHKSQPQGDAIYRLSYDTGGFQTILTVLVNSVLVSAVTLIIMTGIMLRLNWRLTLITLSVAPLLLWTTKLFAGPLKQRWLEAKEVDMRLTTVIQRSVAAIGLVQAFGREADEFNRFQGSVHDSKRVNLRQAWQESWYWLLVGGIFGLGYAIILGYGGWLVYHDVVVLHRDDAMTAGKLWIFLAYVNQVYAPLQSLGGSGATIQSGVAGAQRVFEVLDRDPDIKDSPSAAHLPRRPRVLMLRKVSFEYRPREPVLLDVDATISPGQMVAFVGSSGVGKTTLLSLLPRFYDPTSGSLTLDDIDIRTVKIKDLRAHVALVLQENLILPTTVAENISYGRPAAAQSQIEEAARLAGAASFIEKLPQGYQTVVSESGGNLSGGQRQRIGIARALLTEAPIMVFDEPTSALDPHHEAMITRTLQDLKRQRTIIVVSHRLSTVMDSDQIFVMDEGRIVESGTHQQLLTLRGVYFGMAQQQLKVETSTAV
ncbi:MAG TPA: ABC transporter ATP-binding protein [Tepidisphaeraceae bacterium]|jgi:subfamily B ATP-binding cassette protein MsbA|nr:ABC transporter ATP-binding protein [Tepidisphaeraceae bacterium]